MQRTREAKLGDILHAILRADGLETPLNEYRASMAWAEVMGQMIAKYTSKVEVRGGVMYLSITNAALRQELMMSKASVAARINEHVGAQVVQQIIIR